MPLNSLRKNDVEVLVEFTLNLAKRAKGAIKTDNFLVHVLKFFGIFGGRCGRVV